MCVRQNAKQALRDYVEPSDPAPVPVPNSARPLTNAAQVHFPELRATTAFIAAEALKKADIIRTPGAT